MSLELKTVMGQMNIVGGRWVSEAPNALAVREPSSQPRGGLAAHRPSLGKGDLFVVVEVRADYEQSEKNRLSRSLAETIRNTYYQSSGGVTAGLRRALLAANQRLLAEHSRSPAPAGRSPHSGESEGSDRHFARSALLAGVTAVVVRGEDVFIASVGPAVTYTVSRGLATQLPETSPWLDMADPQATGAPALGRRAMVDAQLFHVGIEPGDMLVLGDSRLAARTSPEEVEKAAAYQGVEGALTNLGKLTGGHDCTALVVEIQAKSTSAPLEVRGGPLRRGQKTAVPDHPPRAGESASGEAVSREPAVTSDAASMATVSQAEVGDGDMAPLDGIDKATQRNSSGFRQKRLGDSPDVATRTSTRTYAPGPARTEGRAVPVGRWLRAVGKGLLALLMVIWTGLRTLISRVLPGQEQAATARRQAVTGQARRVRAPQIPQRLLRTIAVVILIVVLLAVGLTYWQQGLARENEFNSLVEQAQASYQQALGADDTTARDLLTQAETLLTQAEAIKPDEPVVSELRASIAEQQDKIDRVERLYWVGELRSYDDPGTQLKRVVVNGLYVYVLDAGTDQVYRYQLDEVNDALEPDENDPVLVRRGQQVETSVMGEMIDMAWMPAGGERQTSDLLILESGGLLEYNPSWGLTTAPIANKDAWALPVAVGSFFGNFYILDPQAGQILRYMPGAEGYTNPAQYYLSDQVTVDLSGAVDMAIDGFIYVLYADGTVRKFEAGVPVEFQITEIDKPFSRPAAIYTAPDDVAQYLYIADAGNHRVVQLNKDGRFVRQFKPRDEDTVNFGTLRSIFVDELAGKLYLLNDHALYIANITPLQ
jgi:type II secretory pathway pseudopilin PulG